MRPNLSPPRGSLGGGSQLGWKAGKTEEVGTVTTFSAAKPARRDLSQFVYDTPIRIGKPRQNDASDHS
jgi:hypothetical protein